VHVMPWPRPRLVLALLLALTRLSAPPTASANSLTVTDARQLDAIPADADVLRIDLPLSAINSERRETLRAWIAAGGTAQLHTDAARIAGFATTPPLSDLEALGKAVSAAPFGASPLLDGVRKVRYALGAGGCLLLPAEGVLPLLRVEDPPAERREPVLVAGWRRLALGEAFFLPPGLHPTLLDGARLWANWERLVTDRPKRLFVPVDAVLGLSGRGSDGTASGAPDPAASVAAAEAWWAAMQRGERSSPAGGTADRGYLPLSPDDLSRLRQLLGLQRPASVAAGTPDISQVRALAAAWLGREEYQAGRVEEGLEWLDAAAQASPRLDLARAWRGLAYRTQAEQVTRPAPERAALMERAAAEFDAAQHGESTPPFAPDALRWWAKQARYEAQRYALEPPLVEVVPPFVVRYAPGDPSLRAAIEGLQAALDIIILEFGVRPDGVEVLLFPSLADYAAYMTAAGYEAVTEWEAASSEGRRIFSYFQPGREYVGTMAHEFGHVVVGSLTEGGAPVPQWINEGIACAVTPGQPDPRPVTLQAFREGALMGIADLNAPAAVYGRAPATLLYCQSAQMVDFMARSFGKRALLSILHDIGLGTHADAAMRKAIGMDQTAFLDLWVASDLPH
jgi:hypothetical protein